jgi:hypothetical protein
MSGMLTTAQCLVKAAEMEWLADTCPIAVIAADYEKMAVLWRRLALRATWQDGYDSRTAANSN